jgi:hypothetical protein
VKKIKRTGEYPDVEEALVTWFHRQRAAGITVGCASLVEAGNVFYQRLHPDEPKEDFSEGWGRGIMERHHLREAKACGESRSGDSAAATAYAVQFRQKYVVDEGYDERLIFNVDETGLFFRMLPERTLASKIEERKVKG